MAGPRQTTHLDALGRHMEKPERVSWNEYMRRLRAMEDRANQQQLEKERKEAGFCPACGKEPHGTDHRAGGCDGRMTR